MKTKHFLISSVALAACVDPPVDDGIIARNGEEEQGRFLLGNLADQKAVGGWHFAVANAATNLPGVTIEMSGASLVAKDASGTTLAPSALVGMELARPGGGELKIVSTTGGYVLEYRSGPAAAWVDYCDPAISPYAMPMQGSWKTTGQHENTSMISWACQHSGVAAKCIGWGYVPLTGGPGSLEWDHHETCTLMARADYCADGVSHTRELTPIWIRDSIAGAMPPNEPPTELRSPTVWPPPPSDFYFEAAWAPRRPALCLSKLRWASFPIDGLCSTVIPDPRVDPNAKYCEQYTVAELQVKGAILFAASQTMDMVMHRWTNLGTGDTLTTVRGFASLVFGRTISPYPGYVLPIADGILLRNLPGSIGPGEVTARYQQESKTGDRVVATDPPLVGFTLATFEGYTLNANGGDRVPWNLYKKGADYVTAIAPPPGYTLVQQLGYVTAPD